MAKEKLGQILMANGAVTSAAMHQALVHQEKNRIRVGQSLVELGLCDEIVMTKALAEQHGLDFIEIETFPHQPDAVSKLGLQTIKRHFMFPLMIVNDELLLATTCPPKKSSLVLITYESGLKARPVVGTVSAIARAIANLERQLAPRLDEIVVEY